MRLLWSIHLYPPKHNCGSEWMSHKINKFLMSKGHEVRVVLHQAKMHGVYCPYEFEGVEVYAPSLNLDQYRWADVILTHLDFTRFTINTGHDIKRPVINFIHNDTPYESIKGAKSNNHVVYNSQWIANKLKYDWPSMVLTPPCDVEDYNVSDNPITNEYITLISLNENKGGKILKRLARAMPDRKFLGVMGSYDPQIIDQPDNVVIMQNTPDIKEAYKKTRILLMLSRYESWGRTATEAMCSGIPVICTPTLGLKENCSDAGLYIDPRGSLIKEGQVITGDDGDTYDLSSLIKQIKKLDKPNFYKAVSERAKERAHELNSEKQLNDLEQFIQRAALHNKCFV